MDYQSASPSPPRDQEGNHVPKRRRLHGACDACKKKKVKCNSAELPGNICSNCIAARIQCTHDLPRHPKKKDSQQAYIHSLEDRLERLEHLLENAQSGQEAEKANQSTDHPASSPSTASIYSELKHSLSKSPCNINELPEEHQTPEDDASEAEDLAHVELAKQLSSVSLSPLKNRFFGQSSAFMFAQHAANIKSETVGAPTSHITGANKRRAYWDPSPWEIAITNSDRLNYTYPESDLCQQLVSLYFDRLNVFLPLLHRPTFERAINAGQHHVDAQFGMTLLLVCALGSRFSRDPRVMLPDDSSQTSAGWSFFIQVPLFRNTLFNSASLYDLQYYSLAMMYLLSTSSPHLAWGLLGTSMRLAIEKGMHRRRGSHIKPSAEDELSKRAFWCLVSLDRMMSSFLGRPSAIQDEDFDVDYPIECDDEYWETEDPERAFKQPPGKPSVISSFVWHLRLYEILAFTLRTLYSIKKSKVMSGLVGNEWEHRIVAQIDSSLNKWKDSLPPHLQWDPKREHQIFFHQSVSLLSTYHYVEIQVHRPFLTKESPLRYPSLTICTNAARSCASVLEAGQSRSLHILPQLLMSATAAGLVLLVCVWGRSRSSSASKYDYAKEMVNVGKCINVLKQGEARWQMAGRLHDMLNEICSITEQPPSGLDKRRRNSGADITTQPTRVDIQPNVPMPMQHQPALTPSPLNFPTSLADMPDPGSSSSMPFGNNWDLSSLLLIEMGYMQKSTTIPTNPNMPAFTHPTQTSNVQHGYNTTLLQGQQGYSPLSDSPNSDMLSLWSEAPAAFSIDEWGDYLANFSQSSTM